MTKRRIKRKNTEHKTSDLYVSMEALRKRLGLKESEPAYLKCLRCDSRFYSRDRIYNRLCPSCNKIIVFEEVFIEDLPPETLSDTSMLDGEFNENEEDDCE